MSVEAKDGLRFIRTPSNSLDDSFENQTEWPRLSCPQANQLALEFGDLRVDGKIGIGTTTPTEKLEVAGKIKATDLEVSSAITTNQLSVADSFAGSLTVEKDLTVNRVIATNQLSVTGSVTTPLTIDNTLTVNGAIATNQLSVTDSATTGSLTVNDSVGIGTTTPTTQLDVRGYLTLEVNDNPIIYTGTGTSDLNRYLGLINSRQHQSASGLKAGSILVADDYLYANPSRNNLIVKGNVGIGTTNPREKLEVLGRARITEGNQSTFGGHLYLSKQDGQPGRGQWHINIAPNNALNFVESGIADYRLVIKHGGNVGIGTNDPTIKLDVRGGWIGSGDSSQTVGGWRLGRWPAYNANKWLYLSRADTTAYQDLAVGALWAGGARRFGSASDLAEMTPVKSEDGLEAGDVVVIVEPEDDRVLLGKSNKAYDSKVAGVVSDAKSAGLIIGGCHTEDMTRNDVKPIALAGRVLTKVTLENGSIKAGDFLTTSSTLGHAMKAAKPGYVIGKALQSFSGGSGGESTGKIWILVNLSWFGGEP
ncbi:MAG: hypothetical protein F6J94_10075 [Moorea sp. SIO1F2]|uniref:hypothetical protein n=1 Tax=Moorena sp. SIO1F2 TaxID=2607819 RepID=UPI0013BB443C|nr:hypothetical protein [Moorena sp. SIO1F2]NET82269.1 hypothetical protein [Moorena sp. SIO1F2]